MSDFLFNIELHGNSTYQQQIREKLVELIKNDSFGNKALPSSRKMAQLIGVSRNTIVLVCDSLIEDGYLISRKRSGLFVNPELMIEPKPKAEEIPLNGSNAAPDWGKLIKDRPSQFPALNKDRNWRSYPYPFIYGHINVDEFPLYQWRECSRIAESRGKLHEWVEGYIDMDDSELITQVRQHILTKRSIVAQEDEILITLGTQHSLFLLSSLLGGKDVTFGIENPGYVEMHHIVSLSDSKLKALDIGDQGLEVGEQLKGCDYVFTTPSHQYPTTVTMPVERRKALLEQACKDNFVVIEDDYESEVSFIEEPLPALKSYDQNDRVIYAGSLSKSLTPGTRIGYLVANKSLIRELRKLRHYHYRHPPSNNQRITALFISQGYYDSHVRRMRRIYADKWNLMQQGVTEHLAKCEIHSTPGSFCFWIGLPNGITGQSVIAKAALKGIIVESGDTLFLQENAPKNYIRLGFSAINSLKILEGLEILGSIVDEEIALTSKK